METLSLLESSSDVFGYAWYNFAAEFNSKTFELFFSTHYTKKKKKSKKKLLVFEDDKTSVDFGDDLKLTGY